MKILENKQKAYGIGEANMNEQEKIFLYAARDTVTGKLVSDITNPRRKYWDKKGNAENAINYYNKFAVGLDPNLTFNKNKGKHNLLELVTFELVETNKIENDTKNIETLEIKNQFPVQVGDVLWYIAGRYYNSQVLKPKAVTVTEINQKKVRGKVVWAFIACGTRYSFDSIGKIIFRTEKEAEEYIKAVKNKKLK